MDKKKTVPVQNDSMITSTEEFWQKKIRKGNQHDNTRFFKIFEPNIYIDILISSHRNSIHSLIKSFIISSLSKNYPNSMNNFHSERNYN